MPHTHIDLDGQGCASVMSHFELPSERAELNSALRQRSFVHPPSLRATGTGAGWKVDLASLGEIRTGLSDNWPESASGGQRRILQGGAAPPRPAP